MSCFFISTDNASRIIYFPIVQDVWILSQILIQRKGFRCKGPGQEFGYKARIIANIITIIISCYIIMTKIHIIIFWPNLIIFWPKSCKNYGGHSFRSDNSLIFTICNLRPSGLGKLYSMEVIWQNYNLRKLN